MPETPASGSSRRFLVHSRACPLTAFPHWCSTPMTVRTFFIPPARAAMNPRTHCCCAPRAMLIAGQLEHHGHQSFSHCAVARLEDRALDRLRSASVVPLAAAALSFGSTAHPAVSLPATKGIATDLLLAIVSRRRRTSRRRARPVAGCSARRDRPTRHDSRRTLHDSRRTLHVVACAHWCWSGLGACAHTAPAVMGVMERPGQTKLKKALPLCISSTILQAGCTQDSFLGRTHARAMP